MRTKSTSIPDNTKRVTIDATGLTVNSGSIETATIDFTDGDLAITIADGGGITARESHPRQVRTFWCDIIQ